MGPRSLARVLTSDRVHRLGGFLIRVCLAGGLGMLWLLEAVDAVFGSPGWHEPANVFGLLPGLVAIALVLFPDGHIPKWVVPAAAVSLAGSLAAVAGETGRGPMFAETGALLIVLVWTVRRIDRPLGRPAIAALLVAFAAMPVRLFSTRAGITYGVMEFMAVIAAVGLGAYLYSVDARRRRAISTVRHGERLELARELHDFVAHHVTGMVVQAQAAQYIAGDSPAAARESFAAIEKAGLEALTSMRRLVEVMRQEDSGAGSRPLGDLGQTAELVERFRHGDAIATLHVSPDLDSDELAPEVAASIHRIVQEGLTNVRKHAAGVTAVTVAVSKVRGDAEVVVRDDGRAATGGRLSAVGGGFGLEGLQERALAIGGRLSAGPRPEGGWEVVAAFPATGQGARQSRSTTGEQESR